MIKAAAALHQLIGWTLMPAPYHHDSSRSHITPSPNHSWGVIKGLLSIIITWYNIPQIHVYRVISCIMRCLDGIGHRTLRMGCKAVMTKNIIWHQFLTEMLHSQKFYTYVEYCGQASKITVNIFPGYGSL